MLYISWIPFTIPHDNRKEIIFPHIKVQHFEETVLTLGNKIHITTRLTNFNFILEDQFSTLVFELLNFFFEETIILEIIALLSFRSYILT